MKEGAKSIMAEKGEEGVCASSKNNIICCNIAERVCLYNQWLSCPSHRAKEKEEELKDSRVSSHKICQVAIVKQKGTNSRHIEFVVVTY